MNELLNNVFKRSRVPLSKAIAKLISLWVGLTEKPKGTIKLVKQFKLSLATENSDHLVAKSYIRFVFM